jgi:hypothetical protein
MPVHLVNHSLVDTATPHPEGHYRLVDVAYIISAVILND